MNKLTYMQEIVFECINKYYEENGQTPTLSELCEMAGLNTRSTVHEHLKNLQKKGYICVISKLKRGIRIINNN